MVYYFICQMRSFLEDRDPGPTGDLARGPHASCGPVGRPESGVSTTNHSCRLFATSKSGPPCQSSSITALTTLCSPHKLAGSGNPLGTAVGACAGIGDDPEGSAASLGSTGWSLGHRKPICLPRTAVLSRIRDSRMTNRMAVCVRVPVYSH